MQFHYRYVKYGTHFRTAPGMRTATLRGTVDEVEQDSSLLYDNEVAVDVGGACCGWDGETGLVFDHHFQRAGQFPSAAAAVLHHATRIFEQTRGIDGPIWLVSHRQPDFDAWCAMYLARGILQGHDPNATWHIPHDDWTRFGLAAEAWNAGREELDWYAPEISRLPAERRCAVLLASVAAFVDNCRTMPCPMNRTLDSILYASVTRGRDYLTIGALEFFDAVRERLQQDAPRLNPIYDSVLEGHPLFQPELALLDRELETYQQDIRRARRAVVYVQRADRPFEQWYPAVSATPLLQEDLNIAPDQLRPAGEACAQVDGVFLRDPKCLLFKSWARRDTRNSTMGKGFVFSAIAYSGGRLGALRNSTEYYFSLDPERAESEGWHVYNLWARLQAAETSQLLTDETPEVAQLRSALQSPEGNESTVAVGCRPGFEARAGKYQSLFNDPWFDGNNYEATIVATPNRGSLIGQPGMADDLSDDPVSLLVQAELEGAALPARVHVMCSAKTARGYEANIYPSVPQAITAAKGMDPEAYRFCRTELAAGVDPTHGESAESIARVLWGLLDVDHQGAVPPDFAARHVLYDKHSVRVWSRRGVAIATTSAGIEAAKELQKSFKQLIDILAKTDVLVVTSDRAGYRMSDEAKLARQLDQEERLIADLAEYARYLATPEGLVLRRFFDTSGLAEYLERVHQLHSSHANRLTARRLDANLGYMARVQNAVEWVEIMIISIYAVELTHTLGATFNFSKGYTGAGAIALAGLAAYRTAIVMRPWEHGDHAEHQDDHEGAAAHDTTAPPKERPQFVNSFKILVVGLIVFLILGFLFFWTDGEAGGGGH